MVRTQFHDPRCGTEGFDVIYHGGFLQVAPLGWEVALVAGLTPFAFQRVQKGRFLAADVSAGPHGNTDIKIESLDAGNVLAQQVHFPEVLDGVFQLVLYPGVFGPQVNDALGGAYRIAGGGHSFQQ